MSKADKILAFILCYLEGKHDVHLLTIDMPHRPKLFIPDGHIKPNEDHEHALYRVIKEQTGLSADPLQRMRDMGESYKYSLFADQHITYHKYLLRCTDPEQINWIHGYNEYDEHIVNVEIQLLTPHDIEQVNGTYKKLVTPEHLPELYGAS